MPVPKLTLDRQLSSLVSAIAGQQRVLDARYQQDLREFVPVWQQLRAAGLDALGRELAPARMVAVSAEIETHLFVSHERASGMSVRLATLGLQKRYALTTQGHLQLRCTLTARPRPAGAPI